MRSLPLFVAAFLTDLALYLIFAAIPFRALELGAGPLGLGSLPTLYAGSYMLMAALGGRLSDRFSRIGLARTGCCLFVAGAVGLASVRTLPLLYLVTPALGVALGLFWSPVQAALSDRFTPGRLPRAMAAFNMAWSLGKGLGLVIGGTVVDLAAPRTVFLIAAAPVVVTALVLPRRAAAGDGVEGAHDATEPIPMRRVRLAWITNALAFGLVGTVNMHAPRFLLDLGGNASDFGLLLGLVFAVQTLTFAGLARHRPDRWAAPLALGCGLLAMLVFLTAPGPGWRLAAAIPFGLATGIAYDASLHASLHRPSGRGRAAGLHEMVLGGGSSSLPLAAGLASRATGSLAAPFHLAMLVLAAGCLLALREAVRERSRAA